MNYSCVVFCLLFGVALTQGPSCGPSENPGICTVGCPCENNPEQCPFYDEQCDVIDGTDSCCCYNSSDNMPSVCDDNTIGPGCGPSQNPGQCTQNCPCKDDPDHCPFYDDQCNVVEGTDSCCCYNSTENMPEVCDDNTVGPSCGPSGNTGTCTIGCPCENEETHCDFYDSQCEEILDPKDKPCCCYDTVESTPAVCYENLW